MYLLFLDESGTHADSPVFIVGGIAVHENDVWYIQHRLEEMLVRHLSPFGLNHEMFELHATEIKSPVRQRGGRGGRRGSSAPVQSPWEDVPAGVRFAVLDETYEILSKYEPHDASLPMATFGAIVDRRYNDCAKRAYELVFNKFDGMLDRHWTERRHRERGLVIHDEHQVEKELQSWTQDWRNYGGTVGQLNNVIHVPLFTDSRMSRLLQAADFVAFAIWRHYGVGDPKWLGQMLAKFDHVGNVRHGLIHVRLDFGRRPCDCPPCIERATR